MEIKSLGKIDFETIFIAFSKAFIDYDIQLNANELKTMWKRRGFNPVSIICRQKTHRILRF